MLVSMFFIWYIPSPTLLRLLCDFFSRVCSPFWWWESGSTHREYVHLFRGCLETWFPSLISILNYLYLHIFLCHTFILLFSSTVNGGGNLGLLIESMCTFLKVVLRPDSPHWLCWTTLIYFYVIVYIHSLAFSKLIREVSYFKPPFLKKYTNSFQVYI